MMREKKTIQAKFDTADFTSRKQLLVRFREDKYGKRLAEIKLRTPGAHSVLAKRDLKLKYP